MCVITPRLAFYISFLLFLLRCLYARAHTSNCCKKNKISHLLYPTGRVCLVPFLFFPNPSAKSVFDEGLPYLEKVLGSHENRIKASPVFGDFTNLPPLCICVSEREVVYDQSMLLAKRAKEDGVDVTVGVWKYMCHIFPLLCPFIGIILL